MRLPVRAAAIGCALPLTILALAACGGGGDKPTAEDLNAPAALTDDPGGRTQARVLTADVATCVRDSAPPLPAGAGPISTAPSAEFDPAPEGEEAEGADTLATIEGDFATPYQDQEPQSDFVHFSIIEYATEQLATDATTSAQRDIEANLPGQDASAVVSRAGTVVVTFDAKTPRRRPHHDHRP